MTKDEFLFKINETIKETANILAELYDKGCSKETQLRIPNYRSIEEKPETKRVSEQELRFLFIERLSAVFKGTEFTYSVETPTNDIYKFSENGKILQPPKRKQGQSANFDLTISCNGLTAIMEFKGPNAVKHGFAKDLCKLWNPIEDGTLRFMISVLETENSKRISKIQNTLKELVQDNKEDNDKDVYFLACVITQKDNKIEMTL